MRSFSIPVALIIFIGKKLISVLNVKSYIVILRIKLQVWLNRIIKTNVYYAKKKY